jgi:hypothetical protein
VILVGWRTFFKMTSDDFKTYYEQGKKWGDFIPIRFVLDGKEIYSVGLYGMPDEGSEITGYSPKIACPLATQLRITVKLIFFMDAGTPISCEGAIYIFPYRNGDLATNSGYGYPFPVKETPSVNTGEYHVFGANINGDQLVLFIDNAVSPPLSLNPPVQSFKLLIALRRYRLESESAEKPAETQQQDGIALAIYEITGEYYDQWEDLFNMMTQVLYVSMFIMIGVMIVTLIVRMFRSKKKTEEKTVEMGGG